MNVVIRIAIGFVALILGVAAVGLFLPAKVAFERTIEIDRPAATVAAVVSDFGAFNAWSPWADLDPNTVYAYEGPIRGPGAVMRWTSQNPNVGNGEMRLVEIAPDGEIRVALAFDGSTADARYRVTARDGASTVSWGFSTDLGANPIARWFGLVLPGMVGKDYDRGLARLKAYAERLPAADFSGLAVERADLPPLDVAYLVASTDPAARDLAAGAALDRVTAALAEAAKEAAGRALFIPTGIEGDGRAGFRIAVGYRGPPEPDTTGASTGFTRLGAASALSAPVGGDLAAADSVIAKLEAFAAAHRDAVAGPARITVERGADGALRALSVALPIAPAADPEASAPSTAAT